MRLRLRPWTDFLVAFILIVGVDFAFFHRGAYFDLLEPRSHSGSVRRSVERFEAAKEEADGAPMVVFMGNSQTQQGMQEELFERRLARSGVEVRALNLAQGGTSPASWRMLLESLDFSDGQTKAVVLGVSLNALRAPAWRDMEIAKTELRVGQAPWVAGLFGDFETQVRGLSLTLLRLPLFASDVRRYIGDPTKRRKSIENSAKMWRRLKRRGVRSDNRTEHDLTSARLDENDKLVVEELPEPLRKNRQAQLPIERALLKNRSRPGAGLPFNSARTVRVFERLIRELDERGVSVFVTVLPMTAYSRKRVAPQPLLEIVDRLASEGTRCAASYDGGLVRKLEQPEYFHDIVHLNKKGADLFTSRLAASFAKWFTAPATDQS